MNEGVVTSLDDIYERLDKFDKIVSKELNGVYGMLSKYNKQIGGKHSMFKNMVADSIMIVDSAVDTFIQNTEEWMDKTQE